MVEYILSDEYVKVYLCNLHDNHFCCFVGKSSQFLQALSISIHYLKGNSNCAFLYIFQSHTDPTVSSTSKYWVWIPCLHFNCIVICWNWSYHIRLPYPLDINATGVPEREQKEDGTEKSTQSTQKYLKNTFAQVWQEMTYRLNFGKLKKKSWNN